MTKFFDKLLSAEFGTVYRYKLVYSFGFVIHVFYAILFGCVAVRELMWFNIFSSTMYLLGSVFVRNNFITKIMLILLYMEIVCHAVLCSYYLGWEYEFHLFCIAVLPVAFFVTYLDRSYKHPMAVSVTSDIAVCLILFLTRLYCASHEPVYSSFPRAFASVTAEFNMVVTILVIISFSVLFIVKISKDLDLLQEKNDELDFLANYDPLTKMRNRHNMGEIFKLYEKSTKPYCVALGDIDDFKKVNDTYGHAAGDMVLKMVSEIILKEVGDNGVVCRWGGEEILIILNGENDKCISINENIRMKIESQLLTHERKQIHVTMTFGFTDYGDAMSIENLISIADKRLYAGKKNGKNQIVSR